MSEIQTFLYKTQTLENNVLAQLVYPIFWLLQVTLNTSFCKCKEGYQSLIQPDYIVCVQGREE